jgi:hypothetical protein
MGQRKQIAANVLATRDNATDMCELIGHKLSDSQTFAF